MSVFTTNTLFFCRICLDTKNLARIEENEGLSDALWSMMQLAPIPQLQFICKSCIIRVNEFASFKERGQKTEGFLREFCKSWQSVRVKEENDRCVNVSDSEENGSDDEVVALPANGPVSVDVGSSSEETANQPVRFQVLWKIFIEFFYISEH